MASSYKEGEQYPKDKIKEVKSILDSAKKVDKEYKEAVAAADQSMLSRDYDAAKEKFEKALELKDYEEYPKGKLKEIETILAEKAAKEKDYTTAIAEADAALSAKEYDKAVAAYQKALGIKPIETYPLGKMEEAKRLKVEEKQLEERYNKFIANADAAFGTKDYEIAKSDYEKASGLKSEEKYPKDKFLEIKVLIDADAKLDTEYANFIKEG
jgi:tetratricopeptide (TPR) repeat protein